MPVTITNRTAERGEKLADGGRLQVRRMGRAPQRRLRYGHQLHLGRHASEPRRDADPPQLSQAGPDGLRHDLHAGNDDADPRGASARLSRADRRRYVRAASGPAIRAVHRPARAARTDDQAGARGALAGAHRSRRIEAADAAARDPGAAEDAAPGRPRPTPSRPKPAPSPLVYLIGYRGTGKTSTARLLADKLGWSWLDADEFLQAKHGKSIRQIFAEEVEKGFRDKEAKLLQELSEYEDHVIADRRRRHLARRESRAPEAGHRRLAASPRRRPVATLQQDDGDRATRPDLAQGGLAEIEELLPLRAPLYEECHDFAVNTAEQSPEQVAELIFTWLQQRPRGEETSRHSPDKGRQTESPAKNLDDQARKKAREEGSALYVPRVASASNAMVRVYSSSSSAIFVLLTICCCTLPGTMS